MNPQGSMIACFLASLVPGRDMPLMEQITVPESAILDYKCLVTLEDTSATGGFVIAPHKTAGDQVCNPIYVFSRDGHSALTDDPGRCVCPICFTRLSVDKGFTEAPAKVKAKVNLTLVMPLKPGCCAG